MEREREKKVAKIISDKVDRVFDVRSPIYARIEWERERMVEGATERKRERV